MGGFLIYYWSPIFGSVTFKHYSLGTASAETDYDKTDDASKND